MDGSESKQAQIVQNFFTKCVQVIADSRGSGGEHSSGIGTAIDPVATQRDVKALNRWFNLELYDSDVFKEQLAPWKLVSGSETLPPLVVECYLDPSGLQPGQALVLGSNRCSNQEIVLERWVIECQTDKNHLKAESGTEPTHSIYKRAVVSMRSLYTIARLLPAWELHQKLERQKLISLPLKIGIRIHNGSQPISSRGRVGLSKPAYPEQTNVGLKQFGLQPIHTPLGTLVCGVTYRPDVQFGVEDIEKLMAQQFMVTDENEYAMRGSVRKAVPIGPKPILSFTRPFNSSTGSVSSNITGNSIIAGAAGSTGSNKGISIPTVSSVNSASSRFSSSFAKPNPPFSRSLSHSSTDLAEVNEFIKLVDDTRLRNVNIGQKADVDAQLEKFQGLRHSHVQLSESILETVRPERRSSGSRSRLGFYNEDEDLLFALGDMQV